MKVERGWEVGGEFVGSIRFREDDIGRGDGEGGGVRVGSR